jgi:thiamine biosynthesis lipoprotein
MRQSEKPGFGVTRRRFLHVVAGLATANTLPSAGSCRGLSRATGAFAWSGHALGATARLQIHHPDRLLAQQALAAVVAEVERLEQLFSLYRASSALSRLNRDGFLPQPDHHMLRLLDLCRRYHRLTGGAFDASVQPLWQQQIMPSPALSTVDFAQVDFNSDSVRLMGRSMRLTFNGIAQGYITDRAAEILRGYGLDNVLVDFGEIRALGHNVVAGRPWRLGLTSGTPDREPIRRVTLSDRAVATSMPFTPVAGHDNPIPHLFDPETGICPAHFSSVTVTAANAADADALSTAFAVMREDAIIATLGQLPSVGVTVTDRQGRHRRLNA